jgi:hypothetical protein|tara:strand:+ start:1169 stop:1408 length:240 start_codon:yes stop_codon:yes gene_type:complete
MKQRVCEVCQISPSPKAPLFRILEEGWLCRSHGMELLDERENKLTYSPNLNTSITEQRMLDETRVWKAKLKGGSDLRKP